MEEESRNPRSQALNALTRPRGLRYTYTEITIQSDRAGSKVPNGQDKLATQTLTLIRRPG